MKAKSVVIPLQRWPYALEARVVRDGLLITPRRRARASWSKGFRHGRMGAGELGAVRKLSNKFDEHEWRW